MNLTVQVSNPGRIRDSSVLQKVQTGSGTRLASYSMGTEPGYFAREQTGQSLMLITQPHLAPRLKISGATPPLPLYTFTPWTGTILLTKSLGNVPS